MTKSSIILYNKLLFLKILVFFYILSPVRLKLSHISRISFPFSKSSSNDPSSAKSIARLVDLEYFQIMNFFRKWKRLETKPIPVSVHTMDMIVFISIPRFAAAKEGLSAGTHAAMTTYQSTIAISRVNKFTKFLALFVSRLS